MSSRPRPEGTAKRKGPGAAAKRAASSSQGVPPPHAVSTQADTASDADGKGLLPGEVLGDLLPPVGREGYHTPYGGPDQDAFTGYLGENPKLPAWASAIIDSKGVLDESARRYSLLFVYLTRLHDKNLRANRELNARFVDGPLEKIAEARASYATTLDRDIDDTRKDLALAENEAFEKGAAVFVFYDPSKPERFFETVVSPRSPEAHAAELTLPYAAEPRASVPKAAGWAMAKAAAGVLLGISALSVPGFVHIATIDGDPAVRVLIAAGVGVAIAALGSDGVKQAFAHAADAGYRGERLAARTAKTLVALASGAVLIAMDTAVQTKGLMAEDQVLAQAAGLSGGTATPPSTVTTAFVAGFVSVAYVLHAAVTGWTSPSRGASNRVTAAREKEAAAIRVQERGLPESRAAFAAAAKAAGLSKRIERMLAERKAVEADFDAREAGIEKRRRSIDPTLPDSSLMALRQLVVELRGAAERHAWYVHAYATTVDGPIWTWFRHWWWMRRGSLRRGREVR